jgi:hypothetical protein
VALQVSLPPLILNVPSIAHKSPEQVQRLLGPPAQTAAAARGIGSKHTYRGGTVEVVFIDDQADRIVVHDTRGLSLDARSLAKLGLPVTKPTHVARGHSLSWENIRGVRQLTMFAGGTRPVSHVLIDLTR